MQQPRLLHWCLLFLLSLLWGSAFYLIAVGLRGFPPLTLVDLRLAVGALALYPIMRWRGLTLPREPAWWLRFGLLSLAGNLLPFSLISWAETRIASAQAGLLMALMPITTLVLAHFFVSGETITPRRLSGVLLGLLGVTVLIGGNVVENMGDGQLLAQLAVLAATVGYAVNAVYTKTLPRIDNIVVATGTLAAGAVLLLPWALYLEQPWQHSPAPAPILATLALGTLSTGLATWIYFRLVADCGPAFLAVINYLIPAIAFAAGVILLGERAAVSQFLGLLLVCLGIALTQRRPSPVAAADRSPRGESV
jgi:drug/metabolite transporter (DMT)-like permease